MSNLPPIQSSQNPKVQLVRALMNQGKARLKQQAFVAEGVRLLEDALRSVFHANSCNEANLVHSFRQLLLQLVKTGGSNFVDVISLTPQLTEHSRVFGGNSKWNQLSPEKLFSGCDRSTARPW